LTHNHVWRRFFDGHAPHYMDNEFTRNTIGEVDFAIAELGLAPGAAVLDIGCGTGRHSVELARRGYRVTGVDISPGMLAQARQAAESAGVEVEWVQADATQYRAPAQFDAALCLCEGAFSLLGADDDPIGHDLAILRNVRAALRPGAGFLLTALNGIRHVRQIDQADVDAGRFDPANMVETCVMEWEAPGGMQSVTVRERGYVPTELRLLCEMAGFEVEHVGGGTAGDWGRRPVKLDEIELMVIARRGSDDSKPR
jgi:SAM-dependent methyltransferase